MVYTYIYLVNLSFILQPQVTILLQIKSEPVPVAIGSLSLVTFGQSVVLAIKREPMPFLLFTIIVLTESCLEECNFPSPPNFNLSVGMACSESVI